MKFRSFALAAAISLASIAHVSSARANLVVDGGFTDASGQSYITVFSPNTFGGGAWTVTTGSVDVIGNYWQPPVAGQGSLDLDGNTDGAISQTLSGLVTGQTYALTFALSGNPDGSPTIKTVQVSINGQSQTFQFNDSNTTRPSPMNYVTESLLFTYNGTGDVLSFTSLDDPSSAYGAVLGDVSVAPVPEPATWVMMILGFVGIGLMSYRRRTGLEFRAV
jgi:choice-of-anchor C domain-containing protein